MKCVVCHQAKATQKHHISYLPERVIDVCVECHKTVHQHGVGPAKDQIRIITDSQGGYTIPLKEAQIRLWYTCNNCGSVAPIGYPLISFLISGKLRQPMKCLECDGREFELNYEESGVWGNTLSHSSYEKMP